MADNKITFTEEEIGVLKEARDILYDKYYRTDTFTPAYFILKPAFFAADEAVEEILHNRYELDNSI